MCVGGTHYVDCRDVDACVGAQTSGSQKTVSGAFLNLSPPFFFQRGFLIEPGAQQFGFAR